VIDGSAASEPITLGPEATGQAYSVLLGVVPVGHPAPPLHTHPHTDEAFYVASGELTVRLVDRDVAVRSGGFVYIPRGTAHTAWNSGDGPMRGLIVLSPGSAEHVFVPVDPDLPAS
jgi:mannose-6-phosphate isomerase-like protein (cupin superfamily)